ncbi:PREDICTED: zinc finger BED domain-containing protein RICESLEEPER 2-like [Lupinus angustifolius]|uniref:zinc finger BED domain-containing protein RICESLEEPER 2-like n=1 Tax=Lupinus angustifolius TaxID=3871 RepID=UPI00092F2E96|nr:PREDICTED: zinc finger BED domain-containing protein RICESLEEPER 2-like [Lupinus angustifolius]
METCQPKRMQLATQKKQPVIPFRPNSTNSFMTPGAKYSNEKMREALATAIMMHELPFNMVDAQGMMWAFQYGIPEFQKMSRKTIRNDCIAIYEAEKKCLKALLRSVGWKLHKRVLSFVKVLAPRRGVDVIDAIFKCLKSWGIDEKNLSCDSKLVLGGALFHVRCCAHILNLLVQDGLKEIKDVIYNIRESVKYINHNDSRLKKFCDVVEQKHLKERKLVIDCPTRWNFTFDMLSCALNLATHVISSSEYPTANLYLTEVARVKDVIDKASEDEDHFMREMVASMKIKFDKYWGVCNLLMAIASVLDPRYKFQMMNVCFPLIFKTEEAYIANMNKVQTSLQELYCEYSLNMKVTSSNEDNNTATNPSSSQMPKLVADTGFQH